MTINTATEAISNSTVDELQVSGLKVFEAHRWREAILHYLNGVWGNRQEVMYRPKIHFSTPSTTNEFAHVTLRLDPRSRTYWLEGIPPIDEDRSPRFNAEQTIVVAEPGKQTDVEQGLIRFVRDNRIKLFILNLGSEGELRLWKSERRAELNVSASQVRSMLDRIEEARAPRAR